MKRVVKDTNIASSADCLSATVDSVPDIDNRYVSIDVVLSWLDRLVEVHDNEEDSANKLFL